MTHQLTLTFNSAEELVAYLTANAGSNVTTPAAATSPQTPVAPTAPTATPDVDVNGLPWDERIHSPSKAVNAGGDWRGKKGVSAELKAQVIAEITGKQQIQTNPEDRQEPVTPPMQPAPTPPQAAAAPVTPPMQPAPTPPQAAAAPVTPPMPVVDQAPQAAAAPVTPPMQPAPTPPQAAAAPSAQQSFQNFMQTLAPQMQSGVVDTNYLATLTNEIQTAFNQQLSAITDIANNQQMIDYAIGCLQRDGKWV